MSKILLDLSAPTLPAAIGANFSEEMASLARGLPGGELHEDLEIQRFYTGRSGFNGILHTSLARNDKAYVDAKIEETLDYFKAHNVQIGWPVWLSTQPTDLGTYLLAHGLTRRNDHVQMVLDMFAINEATPTVEGLTIKEITDQETLQLWRSITIRGFDITEEMGQIYYEAYKNCGLRIRLPLASLSWLAKRRTSRYCFASLACRSGRRLWYCDHTRSKTTGGRNNTDASCDTSGSRSWLPNSDPLPF